MARLPNRRDILKATALSLVLPAENGLAQNSVGGVFNMVAFEPPVPAPEFALTDFLGKERRIGSGQEEKFVLLNFWATWCPPCVKELPSLEKLASHMDEELFMVFGVSVDKDKDATKIEQFRERLKLSFPIAHDKGSVVANTYGARQFPSTFLVGPKGSILAAAKGERDWHSEAAVAYFKKVMKKYG